MRYPIANCILKWLLPIADCKWMKPKMAIALGFILTLSACFGAALYVAAQADPKPAPLPIGFGEPEPLTVDTPVNTIEYDGKLENVTVIRTASGVKVGGVARGVYGRVVLNFTISGGNASVPPGCKADGRRIKCELNGGLAALEVPFEIELPVSGSAELTVQATISTQDDTGIGGSLDTSLANNTKTIRIR